MEPEAQEAADRIEAMIVKCSELWRESCEAAAAYEDARFVLVQHEMSVLGYFGDTDAPLKLAQAKIYTDYWTTPEYLRRQATVRAAKSLANHTSGSLTVARERLVLAQNVFAATYVGTSRLDGGQV